PGADFAAITGLLDVDRAAAAVSVTIEDCDDEKRSRIRQLAEGDITEAALNLDEIFESYVIGNKGQRLAAG
ncbi:MAG: hypothetical protein ACYSUT_12340, partial [Planctomycetota bacterium]